MKCSRQPSDNRMQSMHQYINGLWDNEKAEEIVKAVLVTALIQQMQRIEEEAGMKRVVRQRAGHPPSLAA